MMEALFVQILNMSLTASVVILVVMLMRMVFRKAPKLFSYALWGIVLFRLLCPFSFSSDLSIYNLLGDAYVEQGQMEYLRYANVDAGEENWQQGVVGADANAFGQGVTGTDGNYFQQGQTSVVANGLQQGVAGADANGLQQGVAGADANGLQQGLTGVDANGLQQGLTGVDANGLQQGLTGVDANGLQQGVAGADANGLQQGVAGADANGLQQGLAGADANVLHQGMSGAMAGGAQTGLSNGGIGDLQQNTIGIAANQASILWLNQKAIPADWVKAGTIVWLVGILALFFYSIISIQKLRKQLKNAVCEEDNVYRTSLKTPFVYGMLPPKIYLPTGIEGREREYILLHERIHIKRGDYLVKILSYFTLCIHWFNPLVWAAFFLSEKDMEMSCDEAVLRKLGSGMKKEYSASLLALATGKRLVSGVPLAFGEGDTGSRIKNILRYKKPAAITLVLAVICCAVGVIVLTANPSVEDEGTVNADGAVSAESVISTDGAASEGSTEFSDGTEEASETKLPSSIGGAEQESTVIPTRAIQNREYGMYLSEYRADVTQDGMEDIIGIYISNVEGNAEEKDYRALLDAHEYVTVAVYDGKNLTEASEPIHTASFAKAHAGNGNLAVIQYEGQECLMYYFNSIYQGIGDYGYEIYDMSQEGEKIVLASDAVRYRVDLVYVGMPETIADKMPDFSEYCNAYQLEQMEAKLNELLADACVLASVEAEAENCYLYMRGNGAQQEPLEEFEQNAFDVFAAEAGRGGQESIQEYCRQWQQEFEKNWFWYKANLDPGYQEALDILDTVYPLYQQLVELERGVECEQEAVELTGLGGSFLKVRDERYSSKEDILELIRKACTGTQALEWQNSLLDTGFYVEQDGVLYHLMADYATTVFSRNIVHYAKVSDTELQLALEVKDTIDGLDYVAMLKLQKEEGLWKMADLEMRELISLMHLEEAFQEQEPQTSWVTDTDDISQSDIIRFQNGISIKLPENWVGNVNLTVGNSNGLEDYLSISEKKNEAVDWGGILATISLYPKYFFTEHNGAILPPSKFLGIYEGEYALVLSLPGDRQYSETDPALIESYRALQDTLGELEVLTENANDFVECDVADVDWIRMID